MENWRNRTKKKNEQKKEKKERASNKHRRARKQCSSYMIKHETGGNCGVFFGWEGFEFIAMIKFIQSDRFWWRLRMEEGERADKT